VGYAAFKSDAIRTFRWLAHNAPPTKNVANWILAEIFTQKADRVNELIKEELIHLLHGADIDTSCEKIKNLPTKLQFQLLKRACNN
jgi:hypothetical protein